MTTIRTARGDEIAVFSNAFIPNENPADHPSAVFLRSGVMSMALDATAAIQLAQALIDAAQKYRADARLL